MTEIHAKPVVDGKFWIVEQDENKVGVLKLTEQKKFVFSSKDTITVFDNKKKLFEAFGNNFFVAKKKKEEEVIDVDRDVHGYLTSSVPYNPM
jgi:hypothetical protein